MRGQLRPSRRRRSEFAQRTIDTLGQRNSSDWCLRSEIPVAKRLPGVLQVSSAYQRRESLLLGALRTSQRTLSHDPVATIGCPGISTQLIALIGPS